MKIFTNFGLHSKYFGNKQAFQFYYYYESKETSYLVIPFHYWEHLNVGLVWNATNYHEYVGS